MPDKVIVTKSKLDALATSIATKSGVSTPMTIAQMKTAVDNISGGGSSASTGEYTLENISPSQSITTNETVSSYATGGIISSYTERIQEGEWYLVTYDGTEYILQCYNQSNTETVLGDYSLANSNTSLSHLSTPFIVDYNSSNSIYFLATRNTNTHTLKIDKFVWIAGGATVGTKTISSNGTYDPSDDSLDYYSSVTVNIPSGSPSLQAKTNIAPTTSSQTITADSGYDGLSSVQINAMPSGSASTPATSITANPSISVSSSGLITATASASKSVTPTVSAGYVSSGTAGTVTVSGSNTSQLTTKAAATITPTTTNQTIASGTYLTGTQTISGDANLVAGNIKSGVSIFGVSGSLAFSTITTSSSNPTGGNNGDVWIKTS